MRLLYNLAIQIYISGIYLSAFAGNGKARKWVRGRRNWKNEMRNKFQGVTSKRIWFHCASLGEFEQGRTLLEKIKAIDPSVFIVVSFFSPSGFEVRKNYSHADYVCYLPSDSRTHAKLFLDIVNPSLIFFVKYEFWLHYIEESFKRKIPLYIVSGIFRKDQLFFKWYGKLFRTMLKKINHFFLQDETSGELLSGIGINNHTVTGDSRFDRVNELNKVGNKINLFEQIKSDTQVLVMGSSWPEDEKLLFEALKGMDTEKLLLIIAPHEIYEIRIQGLKQLALSHFAAAEITLYSKATDLNGIRLLIIDNIGMLSSVYQYATVAWIGGGFGHGIHNILEASAVGKPVIIGPKYDKFREARDLVKTGGAFSISNSTEVKNILTELLNDKNKLNHSSIISLNYVRENVGATDKILNFLENKFSGNSVKELH